MWTRSVRSDPTRLVCMRSHRTCLRMAATAPFPPCRPLPIPRPPAACAPLCRRCSDVGRLGALLGRVVATLQQPLLNDVGIKCTTKAGVTLLHRCREQAAQQFAAWAHRPPAAAADQLTLLAHVAAVEVSGCSLAFAVCAVGVSRGARLLNSRAQNAGGCCLLVQQRNSLSLCSALRKLNLCPAPPPCTAAAVSQEVLWRLDQVLDWSMNGVRLGDGTTWVKSKGYSWVLGAYMAERFYPQGEWADGGEGFCGGCRGQRAAGGACVGGLCFEQARASVRGRGGCKLPLCPGRAPTDCCRRCCSRCCCSCCCCCCRQRRARLLPGAAPAGAQRGVHHLPGQDLPSRHR